MEAVQAVKVEVGQQEAELTQLETKTSRDAVKPEGDRTAVKTEKEPTRWIVCGDVVKLEKQEGLVQQGRLELGFPSKLNGPYLGAINVQNQNILALLTLNISLFYSSKLIASSDAP